MSESERVKKLTNFSLIQMNTVFSTEIWRENRCKICLKFIYSNIQTLASAGAILWANCRLVSIQMYHFSFESSSAESGTVAVSLNSNSHCGELELFSFEAEDGVAVSMVESFRLRRFEFESSRQRFGSGFEFMTVGLVRRLTERREKDEADRKWVGESVEDSMDSLEDTFEILSPFMDSSLSHSLILHIWRLIRIRARRRETKTESSTGFVFRTRIRSFLLPSEWIHSLTDKQFFPSDGWLFDDHHHDGVV